VRENAFGEEKADSFDLLYLEGFLELSWFHFKFLTLGNEALTAVDRVLESHHIILLTRLNALDNGVEGLVN
jgi:hypothetical protein